MNQLKRLLTSAENITRSTFIWNAVATALNSFQTLLVLLVLTHFGDATDSSIFVMAFAVGNLLIYIGKYGVRQYQVTDIKEEYSYLEYFYSRVLSCALMLIACVINVLVNIINQNYSAEKAVVIFLICMVKLTEAFEDVYHGRFQQLGRLDVASKIWGIRLVIFIVSYSILYLFSHNLICASSVSLVITVLLAYVLNRSVWMDFKPCTDVFSKKKVINLMKRCFPLCISLCLYMYIGNAPKYIIDGIVNDAEQTNFNIIFMPVFVIVLFANFIFQPILRHMGELWSENKIKQMKKEIFKLFFLVIIVDFVITVIGTLIGTQILGWLYGINLSDCKFQLLILLICGGIVALLSLLIMVLTTMRYQNFMIYGYLFTSFVLFMCGKKILLNYSITGLCIFYGTAMLLLVVYCSILIGIGFKKAGT